MLRTQTKDKQRTITSRKGKGLKVREEERAKNVGWMKGHPCVVAPQSDKTQFGFAVIPRQMMKDRQKKKKQAAAHHE